MIKDLLLDILFPKFCLGCGRRNGVRPGSDPNHFLNLLNIRRDAGPLWENFIVAERIKHNQNQGREKNNYFWRTMEGKEIDYLEESGGRIKGLEIKWTEKGKAKIPKLFLETYPESKIEILNRENYLDLILQ